MTKRSRWGLFELPTIVNHTADMWRTDDPDVSDFDAAVSALFAGSLESSDLIWADKEFTTCTVDAATDAPDTVTFAPPTATGILALARPLPPVVPNHAMWRQAAGTLPIHAVWWSMTHGALSVSAMTFDPHIINAGRPCLWTIRSLTIGDNVPAGDLVIANHDDPVLPMHTTLRDVSSIDADDFPWVRWLAVAWEMLREPRVVLSRQITMSTHTSSPDADPAAVVSVKSIRPLEHRPTTADDGPGREFSRRWVVRGHWRNQAVGTGRADRRVTWIPSHIKGPADKPLTRPNIVWRWAP